MARDNSQFMSLLANIYAGKAGVVTRADIDLPTADLVPADEECGIPRLRFTWVSIHFLELSAQMTAELEGLPVERRSHGDFCWWVNLDEDGEPVRNHSWSMNFRRYGWAASPSAYGKHMYGDAKRIWANSEDGGLICGTGEEVVRDTLVAHMAELRVPRTLKFHPSVRPLWTALLEDAINYEGPAGRRYCDHAVGTNNGPVGRILVHGEERSGMEEDPTPSMGWPLVTGATGESFRRKRS